ncbi:hypothetical protein VTN96DRAFT_5251 [Rasamsonia emersonii]
MSTSLCEHTLFMRHLWYSGDYSDLKVYCGEEIHRVHRAIICPQSKVFAAMCRGAFKEAQTGEIKMPDDHPNAVKVMLAYFYEKDYRLARDNGRDISESDPDPLLDARVYSVAKKYDVGPLEKLAKEEFGA